MSEPGLNGENNFELGKNWVQNLVAFARPSTGGTGWCQGQVEEYDVEIAKYHADACHSISAPIRRLPDEMMLQIFHLCSPLKHLASYGDWGYLFFDADANLKTEHIAHLAQVCATWRSLVLDSPTLWSTIELDFEYMIPLSNRNNAGEILALARSLIALLQIWIDRYTFSFKELAPSKGKYPLLQTLHISRLPEDCDFFEIAPRLTAVTLESPFPAHPKLPWEQLRSLSYSDLDTKDLPIALAQVSRCPQLTSCSSAFRVCRAWSICRSQTPGIAREDPEMFLVDDILRGLTLTLDSADEPPVPRLHSFECKTFMQSKDDVYLDFIASRVAPGRNAAEPFESSIIYYRSITAANLTERLAEFVLRKEIRSRLERDHTGSLWHTEPNRSHRWRNDSAIYNSNPRI
ncbi:hypothetical protein C8F04DRAFT_1183070 [Mycena alexandri]|uniref:F-box domain-containing protein n=1 Tax=Mycena alexandri TaxID=1745969 RepID=A0AAD6X714_9AGAR|nr:hypothetical protein C8F04DRAFT_1183070 [Mycena alexandri]